MVRATTKVNVEMGNSTPCHAQPHNQSSPKAAYVIRSQISSNVQNLVTIRQGVSFPHMRGFAHQNVYSASFWGSSNDLQPRPLNRFSRVIRQTTRFRARMCLFGLENKNLTFTPRNFRKTAILGPDIDGTKFSAENRFTMGDDLM